MMTLFSYICKSKSIIKNKCTIAYNHMIFFTSMLVNPPPPFHFTPLNGRFSCFLEHQDQVLSRLWRGRSSLYCLYAFSNPVCLGQSISNSFVFNRSTSTLFYQAPVEFSEIWAKIKEMGVIRNPALLASW